MSHFPEIAVQRDWRGRVSLEQQRDGKLVQVVVNRDQFHQIQDFLQTCRGEGERMYVVPCETDDVYLRALGTEGLFTIVQGGNKLEGERLPDQISQSVN